MKIKIEDIVIWALIMLVIGIIVWKLVGSPTDTATLISVTLFIIGSEILLWKTIFSMENKIVIGFSKIKNDLDKLEMNLNFKLEKLTESMNKIDKLKKGKIK